MELTIEGHPSFQVEGTVTIELPSYMQLLPPDELEEARTAENRDGLILAAGRHPSGDIVFLTGAGELLELDCRLNHVPESGRAFPIDFGQMLRFEAGNGHVMEVTNLWSIANARQLIFFGVPVEPSGSRVSYT